MNILIIGFGSIAGKHIAAINSLYKNAVLYALRSCEVASVYEGVQNIYSLNQASITFDFAIISNPTFLHFEYIEKLADLKIPIFVEKPVIHNLQDANRLTGILKQTKIFNYVACNLRFHPCIQFLKSEFSKKTLFVNEVNVYCGSFLPDWRPTTNYKESYSANADMGGGVHLDLFHELDYCCWLFGKPASYQSYKSSKSTLQIKAIDYAHYLLSYSNFNISVTMNYYRKSSKRVIEILFEDDIWLVDLIRNNIIDNAQKVVFEVNDHTMQRTYISQMRYFIEHLQSKELPMNTIEESLGILKICLDNE